LSLPDDLGGANGLRFMLLHRCGIEVLKNNSFSGTKMKDLDISSGHLRLIEENAFVGIEDSLTLLQLDNNKFTEVPAALKTLNNITGIYLDGNNITEIPEDAFPPQIDTIDLSSNPLVSFSSNPFTHINKLTDVRLNNCSLTEVPTNLYSDNLQTIERFQLADNMIEEITDASFPEAFFSNMRFMPMLDNNPIRNFTENAFKGLTTVTVANFLGLYRLETVNFDIFAPMTSLQSVSFSGCRFLVNVTLTDATKLPMDLTAIKVTDSNVIAGFDPTFGVWMGTATENVLNLPDNGFVCNEDLKWMNEFIFCSFQSRITLDRSKCDRSDIPIETYLFQQFDHKCE